jgi:hypothetical protein
MAESSRTAADAFGLKVNSDPSLILTQHLQVLLRG